MGLGPGDTRQRLRIVAVALAQIGELALPGPHLVSGAQSNGCVDQQGS